MNIIGLPLLDSALEGTCNRSAGPIKILMHIVYTSNTPFTVRPIIQRPNERVHRAVQNYSK